ncbi:hypothetical protein [Dactylosporangium salmoneum]
MSTNLQGRPRYGITRAQIAEAQRLRREGDWRGACALRAAAAA